MHVTWLLSDYLGVAFMQTIRNLSVKKRKIEVSIYQDIPLYICYYNLMSSLVLKVCSYSLFSNVEDSCDRNYFFKYTLNFIQRRKMKSYCLKIII